MKKPSRLAIAGIVLVAVFAGVVLLAFGLRWYGAKLRADELLALRAAAQPVLPDDLGRIEDPRPEPTPWLAQLVAAKARWTPTDLAKPAVHADLRDRAAKSDLGGDARDAFARLESCITGLAAEQVGATVVQRVLDVIAAHDGIVAPPPCGLEAAQLLALGDAELVDVARRAHEYGPIDTGIVAATLETTNAEFPRLPLEQSIAQSDALEIAVLRALWSDRPEGVPDLLRAQRDVARIFAGAQMQVGGLATMFADQRLLGMTELALSRLPRDTDLAWLETDLAAIRPRARLALAVAGECAFANRAFERARAGQGELTGFDASLPPSLTLSYDQAHGIRAAREVVERLGQAAFRRAKHAEPGWLDEHLAPITHLLSKGAEQRIAFADVLEARLVLARAALVGFRAGAKDLLEFVATTSDPFDGKPIRVGFGDDGVVSFWSVGPDGIDDGGRDDERDLVWRFRPR